MKKRLKTFLIAGGIIIIIAIIFIVRSQSSSLTKDDFGVYEHGKQIINADDIEYTEYFRYLEEDGREPETKRGIKIGSTVRELSNAYNNEKMSVCYNVYNSNDEQLEEMPGKDFPQWYRKNKDGFDSLNIILYTYNGKKIESLDNLYNNTTKLNDGDIIYTYSLYFSIDDGFIDDITLYAFDSTDAIKAKIEQAKKAKSE